jgi:hypothetical protein
MKENRQNRQLDTVRTLRAGQTPRGANAHTTLNISSDLQQEKTRRWLSWLALHPLKLEPSEKRTLTGDRQVDAFAGVGVLCSGPQR